MQDVTAGGARETPTFHRPGRASVSDGLSVTRQIQVFKLEMTFVFHEASRVLWRLWRGVGARGEAMPPASRKRARSAASASSSSSSSTRVTIVGEPPDALHVKLSAMRASGKLCDVTVRAADGEEFAAHRLVLAASSDYLDALFSSGMADSDLDVVNLTDVPSAAFSAVLTFIYDSSVSVEVSRSARGGGAAASAGAAVGGADCGRRTAGT